MILDSLNQIPDKNRRTLVLGSVAGAATSLFPVARVFAAPTVDLGMLPPIMVYANPPKGDAYYGLGEMLTAHRVPRRVHRQRILTCLRQMS